MSDISQIGHKLKVAAGVFTQFKPKTNKHNTCRKNYYSEESLKFQINLANTLMIMFRSIDMSRICI